MRRFDYFFLETKRQLMKFARLFNALLLGLFALILGILLCEFLTTPSHGHRINFEELPAPEQAIMKEQTGVPISSEQ
jgi:hypothetical protein